MNKIIFLLTFLVWAQLAYGFKDKQASVGTGMFSYNLMKTTNSSNAATTFMGPIYYPFEVRTYFQIIGDYFITPRIFVTVVPVPTEDKAADTSISYFSLPVNGKFATAWDWQFGFGILKYDIKGRGGLVELNNGTGTSTFALPARSASSRLITTELGMGYSAETFRIGTDLIFTGLASERMAYSLFVSASYLFNAGGH